MKKEKNELIERRRKKIRRKKVILFGVILVSVLVTLCLKLPYFNIKNIEVHNNSIIDTDTIVRLSQIKKGTNIFYVSLKKNKVNIEQNPYIMNVGISKKLPDTIDITVTERKAAFYAEKDNKYLIIDKNGVVLEEKDNLNGMNLIKLLGFNTNNAKIGKVIPCDDNRKIDVISKLTDIVINVKNLKITSVDISDVLNLKAYVNNMSIILGRVDGLDSKINKAINIINSENLKDKKGYVDVSFNGNPVYCIQN
ncbi:cell division protein FtsQ/DivIB [Clostridium hydrogenum]|uniref:cell division protein FtsQ/DivIB n=1 Tax=Clostridium hydrogenum TaxID=2855764 RepID=UPI001F2AAF86|nr:FtsQ-type POTRA domain-containing protein [Clostridium hydrogenum]